METITIARYGSERDNNPVALELSWAELVEALTTPDPKPCTLENCKKKDCPHKYGEAWSPVRIEGGRRADANVKAVTVLVLDLDDLTLEQLQHVEASVSDYQAILHSTHSDRIVVGGLARLRLVVALEEEIPAAEYREWRRRAVHLLGLDGLADPKCKDLSRLYFCPSSPTGYEPLFGATEGKCLPRHLPPVETASGASPSPPAMPSQPVAQVVPATAAPSSAAPEVIDLEHLRRLLADRRRSKAHRTEPEEREKSALLGRVLDGRPLADIGARDATVNQVASMIAHIVPQGTPVEAVLEVMRASLAQTPLEDGETMEQWFAKATSSYERAAERRVVLLEERKKTDQAILDNIRKVLSGKSEASGKPEAGVAPAEDGTEGEAEAEEKKELLRDGHGNTRPVGENVNRIVDMLFPPGAIRWNEFDLTIDVDPDKMVAEVASAHPDDLGVALCDYLTGVTGIAWPEQVVERRVLSIARKHSYDPLKEYLLGLRPDGTKRIETFLIDYCGAKDTPHIRRISRQWFVALAARGLNPGCKFDTVLVFESPQGKRKSTLFRTLGGRFFTDTQIVIGDKDSRMLAASSWIIELAELDSVRRSETSAIRAFLTSTQDKFRPPYGKAVKPSPRRCGFVGTTNDEEYLNDPTGNRRYQPVRVGEFIDIARVERDRDLLWAEAVALYFAADDCPQCRVERVKYGTSCRCAEHRWWLEGDEELAEAREEVEKRETEHPWKACILEWFYGKPAGKRPTNFSIARVAEEALEMSKDKVNQSVATTVGNILRKAGFAKVQSSVDAARVRLYAPTEEMQQADCKVSGAAGLRQVLKNVAASATAKVIQMPS